MANLQKKIMNNTYLNGIIWGNFTRFSVYKYIYTLYIYTLNIPRTLIQFYCVNIKHTLAWLILNTFSIMFLIRII